MVGCTNRADIDRKVMQREGCALSFALVNSIMSLVEMVKSGESAERPFKALPSTKARELLPGGDTPTPIQDYWHLPMQLSWWGLANKTRFAYPRSPTHHAKLFKSRQAIGDRRL
jgi:hypothetical protein